MSRRWTFARKGARLFSTAASSVGTRQSGSDGFGSKGKNVAAKVFFLVASAITCGMGVWQTQRYYWKVDTIENSKKSIGESLIKLSGDEDYFETILGNPGRRIELEGSFDHENEVILGIRSAPIGATGNQAQGLAVNPQGYYVITPFILRDGRKIFVNRGWVPQHMKDWTRPSGPVTCVVILSNFEHMGNMYLKNTEIDSKKLMWLEESALLEATENQELPYQSIIVDAFQNDFTKDIFPLTKSIQSFVEHGVAPETHIGYAATWYSLSLASFVFAFMSSRKRRPRISRK